MSCKVVGISGARPNFMKLDPVLRALDAAGSRFSSFLVHTGQHYDEAMSQVFFRDLGMRPPDIDLGVGSGSHAEQTAGVMVRVEPVLLEQRPDLVIVVGDVNSTIAVALTAAKLHIPVAHVEAGLRSGDRRMPEEINRLLTDSIADELFTPSADGDENLLREGIPAERIHLVGNVMIDSLERCLPLTDRCDIQTRLKLDGRPYALLTLHRPSNVDDREALTGIVEAIDTIRGSIEVVFPVHPRTQAQLERFGLQERLESMQGVHRIAPVGYIEFLALQRRARMVLTDSGGIQEETTVLGVPCLTLRPNTERPITVTQGTNRITGSNRQAIVAAAEDVLASEHPQPRRPDLWDGHAAQRIVEVLSERY